MDTILIVGVDSVVGANLAATLSDSGRVIGLTIWDDSVGIEGCKIARCPAPQREAIRQCVAAHRPKWIIHCGPAAESAWQHTGAGFSSAEASSAGCWARAAGDLNAQFTLISSDAIFTGPWMFHTEECNSFCPSQAAAVIREIERTVCEQNPAALVVRTNAYGWLPRSTRAGWIESLLVALENRAAEQLDCVGHATPILATDLAEILKHASRAKLQGVYHIGGAERTNLSKFVTRLAEVFELPAPRRATVESPSIAASGFGRGETSLQSIKVRKALGLPLPMLDEGLLRLSQQRENGHRDRLRPAPQRVHEKVA